MAVVGLAVVRSGDIELNPGPQVLVQVGIHSRVVMFEVEGDIVQKIKACFHDVPHVATATQLHIQTKDLEWGGFVDLIRRFQIGAS